MKNYQKIHEERLNGAKVGKVLLKDEYGKTGPEIIEKQYQLLSLMETFERRFEYRSIVKAFETTMYQKNRFILSGIESNRKNNILDEPKLLLTKIKYKPFQKERSVSALKLYNKNANKHNNKIKLNRSKKIIKTLSYDNFPIFKRKSFNQNKNIFPFLFHSPINKELKTKKNSTNKVQKVICFPSNCNNANFTNSINLRMEILKKNEKDNKMKKYISLKNLFDNNKELNNNDKYKDNSDFIGEEREIEKDPFKDIRNKFEYSKMMENLKEQYKFYPYSYLEEHKNIEPKKFKFMIDNFNSKFSLFGNNNILNEQLKKFRKKINFNGNYKPSVKIMEKILKNKEKENL